MKIDPIKQTESVNLSFRGIPPVYYCHRPMNTEGVGSPKLESRPGGILLREHPELPEGVGEKLDIIA